MTNENNLKIDDVAFEELVSRVREFQGTGEGSEVMTSLTGVDADELQAFLEEKAGVSPDEEAQGSVMAAALSVAWHC